MREAIVYNGAIYKSCVEASIELGLDVGDVRDWVRLRQNGFRRVKRVYKVTDKKGNVGLYYKSDNKWIPVVEGERPLRLGWEKDVEDVTLWHGI